MCTCPYSYTCAYVRTHNCTCMRLCAAATVGERFAELHGIDSENGKKMLAQARSLHKARDNLLLVLRPAFVQAIARTFISSQAAAPTFADFKQWLQQMVKDDAPNKNLSFAIKFGTLFLVLSLLLDWSLI